MDPFEIEVEIHKVEEAEMDEMWSFVGKKECQRWLWYAIHHDTGTVLAYAFGMSQKRSIGIPHLKGELV